MRHACCRWPSDLIFSWILAALLAAAFSAAAAPVDTWLKKVEPVLSKPERQRYLSLISEAERDNFRNHFFDEKNITQAEYFGRLEYIDARYGSSQPGSGANTDQGRLYLSLGPPQSIERIPSSRMFVPTEVWYYQGVPVLGINTRLQFLFYERSESHMFRLYSPQLDTIRSLLLPTASTRGAFPVNDVVNRDDIINRLKVPPAETHIVDAALQVAQGIKGSGNDEILFYASSPEATLRRGVKEKISSRFFVSARPEVEFFTSWTPDGIPAVDLAVHVTARARIAISVLAGAEPLDRQETTFEHAPEGPSTYVHRLFLLPGAYTVVVEVDAVETPFPITVPARQGASEILLGARAEDGARSWTPWRFAETRVLPAPGTTAVLQLSAPADLRWRVVEGGIASRLIRTTAGEVDSRGFVFAELGQLPRGNWSLQVETPDGLRTARPEARPVQGTLIAFNANLGPGAEWLSVGEQYLARREYPRARTSFDKAGASAQTPQLTVDLARLDALEGKLDSARDRLSPLLARDPGNFAALCAMAFVERGFQDYVAAARYYEKALALREDPIVRRALDDTRSRR